jgi:hypothetical protein
MARVIEIPNFDRAFFGLFVAALVELAVNKKLNDRTATLLLQRLLFEPDASGQPVKNAITDAFIVMLSETTPGAFFDTVFAYMAAEYQQPTADYFAQNPAAKQQLVTTFTNWQAALKEHLQKCVAAGSIPDLKLLKGRAA